MQDQNHVLPFLLSYHWIISTSSLAFIIKTLLLYINILYKTYRVSLRSEGRVWRAVRSLCPVCTSLLKVSRLGATLVEHRQVIELSDGFLFDTIYTDVILLKFIHRYNFDIGLLGLVGCEFKHEIFWKRTCMKIVYLTAK